MNYQQLTALIRLNLIFFGISSLIVGIPFLQNNLLTQPQKVSQKNTLVTPLETVTPKKTLISQTSKIKTNETQTNLQQKPNQNNQAVSENVPEIVAVTLTPALAPTIAAEPTSAPDLFSQLSSHSTQSDCWVTYRNHLYDITAYFGQHPGGSAVMALFCGHAMDLAYDTKNFIPGKNHSARADQLLQTYLIQ